MDTQRVSPAGSKLREPYAAGVDLQGSSAFRAELRRMLHDMRATKTGQTLFAGLAKAHAARGHVTVIMSWVFETEINPNIVAIDEGSVPVRAHRDPKTER